MGVAGERHDSTALPPGKIQYQPLTKRLDGPQGQSGRVRKIPSQYFRYAV